MSRQDMDTVLNDGINIAVHFIEKNGEFFPFGVVRTRAGEIRHIQTLMSDSRPTSDTVSEALEGSLKEGADVGDYNTVAIVSNVEITDKISGRRVDAISVLLDDRDSDPILCYVRYEIQSGSAVLGDLEAGIGTRIAFAN